MKPRESAEKYRHELKFLINQGDYELMRARMTPVFKPDKNTINGQYMLRSLYFDDYQNSAYEQKEDGILERKKYRIRIYNYSDGVIKLERKKKYDAYIYKESAGITREEFEKILRGDVDFMLGDERKLLREFYIEHKCNFLRPKVIVDYEREPYVIESGDVRVTFDMNLRAAVGSFDIFDESLPCLSCIDPGKLVLEVKFTEFLPEIARELLPPKAQEWTALSKYVICCDKTAYLRDASYWNDDGQGGSDIKKAFPPKRLGTRYENRK